MAKRDFEAAVDPMQPFADVAVNLIDQDLMRIENGMLCQGPLRERIRGYRQTLLRGYDFMKVYEDRIQKAVKTKPGKTCYVPGCEISGDQALGQNADDDDEDDGAKRLRRLRQCEPIMKQPGTTKRPHTKCLWEVQKKPRLGSRPEKMPSNPGELLVLPSLTVDGKMLVACSKIRQRAFDEGSIS